MTMKWIPRGLEAFLLCAGFWFAPAVSAADAALDTGRIEQLTGLKGTLNQQEGVFKVNFPRKDIQATVGGTRLIPDQGLTAWAAFTRAGDHTMVMGDIVLLENEVNPVMSAALDSGLDVTALHNHFLWDTPKVMFMHIGGMGDEAELARAAEGGDRHQAGHADGKHRSRQNLLRSRRHRADCRRRGRSQERRL